MVAINNIKPADKLFEAQRDKLKAIAYRMLGTMSDAEDVLQDGYLRWSQHWGRQDRSKIDNPAGYLTSLVTRLCLDRLRHRRVERAHYVGPWLPEPVLTETRADPAQQTELLQSINTAFLLLLESLSPTERAVFTLKEAFDYSHADISNLLGVSLAQSRQLLHRAHRRLSEKTTGDSKPGGETVEPIVEAFYLAAMDGDMDKLATLLCEDVVAYSDGGGVVSAALIPLEGIERVSTVFAHIISRAGSNLRWQWCDINHQRGVILRENDGLNNVTTFDLKHGKIHRIYTMRNPRKLRGFQQR